MKFHFIGSPTTFIRKRIRNGRQINLYARPTLFSTRESQNFGRLAVDHSQEPQVQNGNKNSLSNLNLDNSKNNEKFITSPHDNERIHNIFHSDNFTSIRGTEGISWEPYPNSGAFRHLKLSQFPSTLANSKQESSNGFPIFSFSQNDQFNFENPIQSNFFRNTEPNTGNVPTFPTSAPNLNNQHSNTHISFTQSHLDNTDLFTNFNKIQLSSINPATAIRHQNNNIEASYQNTKSRYEQTNHFNSHMISNIFPQTTETKDRNTPLSDSLINPENFSSSNKSGSLFKIPVGGKCFAPQTDIRVDGTSNI